MTSITLIKFKLKFKFTVELRFEILESIQPWEIGEV